jgi:hypothetical protein
MFDVFMTGLFYFIIFLVHILLKHKVNKNAATGLAKHIATLQILALLSK